MLPLDRLISAAAPSRPPRIVPSGRALKAPARTSTARTAHMGDRVSATEFSPEDRLRYRVKVKACLAALRQLLADQRFETERKLIGLELELNIADSAGCPLMVNDDVLKLIESADYQTELGQFNIEVNVAPHKLVGTVFRELEEEVRTSLNYAERRAGEIGAHIVMIGILPTLRNPHVTLENVTNNPRYALLNDQVLAARGEALLLQIDGVEQLPAYADSIAPGRQHLVVEQRVPRVVGDVVQRDVRGPQRRQDTDHDDVRTDLTGSPFGIVQAGANLFFELAKDGADELVRRDVDLDVELTELGLVVRRLDQLQHVVVEHQRAARGVGDVQLELQADELALGLEPLVGEQLPQRRQAGLDLDAVAQPVLRAELGG